MTVAASVVIPAELMVLVVPVPDNPTVPLVTVNVGLPDTFCPVAVSVIDVGVVTPSLEI